MGWAKNAPPFECERDRADRLMAQLLRATADTLAAKEMGALRRRFGRRHCGYQRKKRFFVMRITDTG
jgi:hypothetical protein